MKLYSWLLYICIRYLLKYSCANGINEITLSMNYTHVQYLKAKLLECGYMLTIEDSMYMTSRPLIKISFIRG